MTIETASLIIQRAIDTYPKLEMSKITSTEIADKFKNAGFRIVKTGAAAIIFHKSGEQVVKIFKMDRGYKFFLDLIKKNPSKHFPNVRITRRFIRGKYYGWYVAKMEKLEPLKTAEYIQNLGYHCFLRKFQEAMDFQEDAVGAGSWIVLEHNREYIEEIKEAGINTDKIYKSWLAKNIGFAKAFRTVYSTKTRKYGWDLHAGNIMKRGPDWVIIDPYNCENYRFDPKDVDSDVVSEFGWS